jgi:hypothetical protein
MARTGSRSRRTLALRLGATVVAAGASLGLLAACASSSGSSSGGTTSTSTSCARPSNFPSGGARPTGARPTNFPSGTRPTGAFGNRPSGCAGFGGFGGGAGAGS